MAVITSAIAIGNTVLAGLAISTSYLSVIAAVGFATQIGLGLALNALTPKPKVNGANRGYDVNSNAFGSALDHQIIYGEMRVGGAVLYDNTTGKNNKFLHRVIAYAGHEVESFEGIYIEDELLTIDPSTGNVTSPSRFNGKLRIITRLGASNQTAISQLVNEVPEWTNNHRLQGIAYIYVRLAFDQDAFPNGVPNFTAQVKGKKVFDPRNNTTAWSDNPALCIRDYLTSTGYGVGEAGGTIDDDRITTAANVCQFFNFPTLTGSKRFTCNGAFTTAVTPYDILGDLLSSMGGMLWYSQGKWRVKPAYYTEPVLSINEDDLRSSISLMTRHSRRDNFNTVKGTFKGEETNWQVTDYPEVTNSAFVAEDGGQPSVVDIDLPFTSDSVIARRIALIALERNRQQLTVSAAFGMRAFSVQTGDIIRLSNTRFGWDEKEFEVTSWTFGLADEYDLQVQMVLREISESVFDDVNDGIVYSRDNTNLVSPFEVPPVGLVAAVRVQVANEKLTNIATATVTSANSAQISLVEVQFKPSSESAWLTVGTGELGRYEVVDLQDGFYDFRARAVNTFGIRGDWTFVFGIEANSLGIAPSNLTGLTFEISDGTTFLEWDPIPDAVLSYYQVRHAIETENATWANSTTAIDKVPRPASSVALPSRAGSYLIRPFGKGGLSSLDYSTIVIPAAVLPPFANTLTQTESPTFSGTKTGCSVNANDFLEITDPSVAPSSATYDFSDIIDTGAVRRVKARVDAGIIRVNEAGDTFEDLSGNFDTLTGLFDDLSGEQDFADTNLEFFISTTEDDPTGTPTWTPYVRFRIGDYFGRAFRFKTILKSSSNNVTPNITSLSAVVEYN